MGLQEANKKIYEWAGAAIKIMLTSKSISSTRGETFGINGWGRVDESPWEGCSVCGVQGSVWFMPGFHVPGLWLLCVSLPQVFILPAFTVS